MSDDVHIAPPAEQKNRTTTTFDIRGWTIAKTTFIILLIWGVSQILFLIRDKLLILILALFIALVMDTSVRRLERFRIPRALAVILLYIIFLSITIFLFASLIPIVANELQEIARYINERADSFFIDPNAMQLPFLSEGMNEKLTMTIKDTLESMGIKDRASALETFGQNLSTIAQSGISFAVSIAGSVFNLIVTVILILVLAFFIQLEKEKMADMVRSLLPRDYRSYYDTKADAVYHKISQWVHGQLLLCFAIGCLVFVALQILGMPYAVTLALLAGFTEFIPYAGPLVAALPAVLIALSQFGFAWALAIALIYYVIQFCENNLLVPLIMKHAVGLSPIAIIFGMLVGVSFPGTVHPVVGIILAVPTTAILTIFVHDLYAARKRK